MKCKKARRKLNAFLDGELSVREADRVRQHLEACEQCAEELRALERLNGLLQLLPSPRFAVGLVAAIRRRAEGQLEVNRRPAAIAGLLPERVVTAVAAALLMAVGLLAGGLMGSSISAAEVAQLRAQAQMAEADLGLGSLGAAPPTSVAAAYLELTGEGN